MNSYREMLHAMLASTITRETHKGSANRVVIQLEEAILKLNNDTIELGRQRVRDSDAQMSANAILIKMQKEMGTRE